METRSPWVRVTGRSRSTKKSWKTFRLDVPVPSAPRVVDASMDIRQVVIESARGMLILARPSESVMISGLMYRASGKYDRTRAAGASSFSLAALVMLLTAIIGVAAGIGP